jgi:DNA-directed RNA polymerase
MIDPEMVKLVERHALRIMNADAKKRRFYLTQFPKRIGPPKKYEHGLLGRENLWKEIEKTDNKIEANEATVKDDVRVARKLEGKTFWLDYNCDYRGRVYAVQHFNYMREDHVRSLFKFANGIPLTKKGLEWLEVHCANCEGSTEKESYGARQDWVKNHRHDIIKIANNPDGTFKDWAEADKPFAYVAACRELKAAWEDQAFESHLPIPLDGSCNGIQHLACLKKDLDVAKLVNLVGDVQQDIYLDVAVRVRDRVQGDDGESARFWRECFGVGGLTQKEIRKLCKQPVMTFGYGVTRTGMVRQLVEAYKKLRRNNWPREEGAWGYLADQIICVAAAELLRGPQEVMNYVTRIAEHCASKGRLMEWTSPTGFPCVNRYQEGNIKTVSIGSGVERVRHRVGDGWGKEILMDEARRGAAPNFVHSQDAAHLAHTVNGFGKDILTVHDSFSCHAENVAWLHFAIRAALVGIYLPEDYKDWLVELRTKNVSSDDVLAPPMGDLDVVQIYFFSPYAFD